MYMATVLPCLGVRVRCCQSVAENSTAPLARWGVATEVDFDSTLIDGDNHLIDAVLGAEDLGATPIEPGDCLDSGGDTVNVYPVTDR
jgi:hypothetical protein